MYCKLLQFSIFKRFYLFVFLPNTPILEEAILGSVISLFISVWFFYHLKGHLINFTCKGQFICHEEYYSASKNNPKMSSVAPEGAFQSLRNFLKGGGLIKMLLSCFMGIVGPSVFGSRPTG